MNTVIKYAASFLAGLIGAMGFGGGGILIIYLTVFAEIAQTKAQGINLAFFIPCAVCSVIVYSIKKEIDFKTILPVILGGAIGAAAAGLFIKNINEKYLSVIFAVFLIIMGIFTVFGKQKSKNNLD